MQRPKEVVVWPRVCLSAQRSWPLAVFPTACRFTCCDRYLVRPAITLAPQRSVPAPFCVQVVFSGGGTLLRIPTTKLAIVRIYKFVFSFQTRGSYVVLPDTTPSQTIKNTLYRHGTQKASCFAQEGCPQEEVGKAQVTQAWQQEGRDEAQEEKLQEGLSPTCTCPWGQCC